MYTVDVSGTIKYDKSDTTDGAVPETTECIAAITLTDRDGKTHKTTIVVPVGPSGSYKIPTPMVERGTATIILDGEEFWEYTESYNGNKRALYRFVLDRNSMGNNITVYDGPAHTNRDVKYTKATKINDLD
jgi:hypothetical protein